MLERCKLFEMNEKLLQECNGFSCGDKDIDEFFTQEYEAYAYELLGKSYCFVNMETHQIVAAFTVSNSILRVDYLSKSKRNLFNRTIPNPKRRSLYPAVLVGQLGINHPFQGKHIGNEALDFIKAWFVDPMNKTGCRYIIVDAINHPKVIDFYKRNGFCLLFDTDEDEWLSLHGSQSISEDGSIPKIRTRLMYFNLMVLKKGTF